MRRLLPLLVSLAACTAPLGTDDVELVYRADGLGTAGDAATNVRLRLDTSRITADVTLDGDDVRIRVASHLELPARRALDWNGDVAAMRLDPKHVFAAGVTDGLEVHDGYFTGGVEAVQYDALFRGDDTDSLVFSETRAWTVSRSEIVRSRAGRAAVDGTTVVVEVARDTDVPAILARDGDTEVALVVARQVIWRGLLRAVLHDSIGHGDPPTLVFSRGDDLLGYQRARRTAVMLDVPPLVPPVFVAARELPADWPLAIVCMLIPIATGLGWLVFVRRFDPARAEPWWLVLATFALGFALQRVAGVVELGVWHASEYLDHRALSLDHRVSAFPLSFLACAVVVGANEEGVKWLATLFARRRREFDEPIDGIVYAAAAAVGFAAAENIVYFTDYRLSDGIAVGRSLLAMPGHVMMSAIWGYALGQRLLRRNRLRGLGWFALAVAVHALWDTSLDFRWMTINHAILAAEPFIFIVLVRRALRWGVVDDPNAAAASGARTAYRVGQPLAMVVAIAAMYAVGWVLLSLADGADLAGERLTWLLLAKGSVLGVMFAAAAFAVARVIPLDVVVDDRGVTFAGALHRWSALRGATRVQPWLIVLHGETGDVRLGPGSRATLDKLEAALKQRIS